MIINTYKRKIDYFNKIELILNPRKLKCKDLFFYVLLISIMCHYTV